MPVAEKFLELQQLGKTPVCLFPTRKQCDELEGLLLASPFVLSNCSSVSEYINTTGMDKNRTWDTEAEMFVLAHKLNTNIMLLA